MNRPLFAIAASSFSQPSETFIRDHARAIAPGRTIVLSQRDLSEDIKPVAALTGLDFGAWRDGAGSLPKPLRNVQRYWRRYLAPVLPDADRAAAVAFLQDHKPAALMAEYGPTGVMVSDIAKEANTPLFVHFHGFDASIIPRLPLWPGRYRALFEAAAGVIGPSQFIADMLVRLGCPPAKAHVCACGIDADRFAAGEGVPFNVLAVGRLVEKKAPHATIDAFAKIAGRFPDARLDIVGDGPLRKRCDELIRNLGLEGRVVLHGAKSHDFVAELFRRASVFVQHSVTTPLGDVEGMPVSVLEAMASGLPVVSTMHSGIQEAVVSGETGLLVRERDVEGMASAIAALLENPGRAAEMGARGRERVLMRYTQEKSAEKLRSIMGL